MKTYLLKAPHDFVDAGIPQGFMIQVISSSTGSVPDASEVRDILHRVGFSGHADHYASPDNWIVKERKRRE